MRSLFWKYKIYLYFGHSVINIEFIYSQVSNSHVDEERKNVIEEIISTEQNYLDCLEIVREVFMKTLGSGDVISLSPQEMEVLFINWNDLRQCSKRLFK